MRPLPWIRATVAVVLALCLAACGGGGGGSGGGGGGGGIGLGQGSLRVALTDDPACGYDEVVVTVSEVRVHTEDAPDADPNWRSIAVNPPISVDLLDLRNGALLELGQTRLPPGVYTQLRLVLDANTGSQANRNWVVLSGSGGGRVPLKTPSAQQSGLKVQTRLDVRAGELSDAVIDFDACRSVVAAGNSGQYLLKPVLRVLPRSETGVVGEVSLAAALAGATVSLQQDGEAVRSTVADANGQFKLQPVAPGLYTLVVVTPGRATAAVRQLQVVDGQLLRVAPTGQRIDTPVSLSANFSGQVRVTPQPAEIEALVALRQTLGTGEALKLAEHPVNALTGAYAFSTVAVDAPRVASYAGGNSLSFAADNAAIGRFTLRASQGGVSKFAGPLAPAAGATLIQDFVFP